MDKITTTHGERQGVLVAHLGVAVEVRFDAGGQNEIIRVKRNSGHVVGDNVTVKGEILSRLNRRSVLNRMDAGGSSVRWGLTLTPSASLLPVNLCRHRTLLTGQ